MRGRRAWWRGVSGVALAAATLVSGSPAPASTGGTITTMAGGPGAGTALGVAQTPVAIALAGTKLYVLDVDPDLPPPDIGFSAVVRAIDVNTGQETVAAGDGVLVGGFAGDGGDARSARFHDALDVAADTAGNVYVADFGNNRIRRISAQGVISTVAGGDTRGFGGDGGPASSALLDGPSSLAVDGTGRLFFWDRNNWRVRRIDTSGVISTVAGTGTYGTSGDGGPAVSAQVAEIKRMTVDANGVLYLSEVTGQLQGRIRRVAAGLITTVTTAAAGSVVPGDTPGSLFTIGWDGSVLRVAADGSTTVLAGDGTTGYVDGPAAQARFVYPTGLAGGGTQVYVADHGNRRVRRVASAQVTTVAGNGTTHEGGDGGPASDAQLRSPSRVTGLPDGSAVFIDSGNNRLRRVRPDGTIVAFAGTGAVGFSGDGGPATAATLSQPLAVATTPDGSVVVADYGNRRIRRISPPGVITTIAGTGAAASDGDGGPATQAAVQPGALSVDANGWIWFVDGTDPIAIRIITSAGTVVQFMSGRGEQFSPDGSPYQTVMLSGVQDIVVLADGVYLSRYSGQVNRIDKCGQWSTVATFGAYLTAIAGDAAGNLYVTEVGSVDYQHLPVVNRVARIGTDGTVSTVAGAGPTDFGGDGGPGPAATLRDPWGVAVLAGGDLAIADAGNFRLRRVAGATAGPGDGGARPCWTAPPPPPSQPLPTPAPAPARSGYWMVARDGSVYAFGDASYFGPGPAGAVDLEPTPRGDGYWIVNARGEVRDVGAARYLGSATGLAPGESVTSLSATPSGTGYWLFTTAGRVLPFGDAPFLGDMHATRLNAPVLDSIPTPSGHGYYMVAADGGIFTFGDARFRGSMGATHLNAPVQSLVPTAGGDGYWLVASDGGVFAFGAPFRGSMGGARLNRPVTGMVPFGSGYLMVGEDGGIFNFSDKPFLGSLGASPPAAPVAAVAVLGS